MKRTATLIAITVGLLSLSACDVLDVQSAVDAIAPAPEAANTPTAAPTPATIPGPGPVGTVLHEGETFGVIIGDTSPGWEDRCRDTLHGSPALVARGTVIPVLPGEGYNLIPFCLKATATA